MSHYTVLVIGPTDEDELANALAPFEEDIEVPPYISETKADQIRKHRRLLDAAAAMREQYEQYRPPYTEGSHARANRQHVDWITKVAPVQAQLDDEALWRVILSQDPGTDRDVDGHIWSTRNPLARWDWWAVGGRWNGIFTLSLDKDHGLVRDLAEATDVTFAVLHQGVWHERGRMGWFGQVSEEQDDVTWHARWRALLDKADPDEHVWLVDIHI